MAYTYNGQSVAVADRRLTEDAINNYQKSDEYRKFYDSLGSTGLSAIDYHASRDGGSGDDDDDRNGRGRGRGRGGMAAKPKKPLNLKVYKRGKWDTNGLSRRAKSQADARNREAMLASKRSRMDADNQYQRSIRELELDERRKAEQNASQRDAALAANNNTALNRGMGFGQGFLTTQTNARMGYDKQLSDLMEAYAMQRGNLLGDRNNIYAQMAEADRVTQANRQALMDEILGTLEDRSWNRYMGTEGLRQQEIDSINNYLRTRYDSLR